MVLDFKYFIKVIIGYWSLGESGVADESDKTRTEHGETHGGYLLIFGGFGYLNRNVEDFNWRDGDYAFKVWSWMSVLCGSQWHVPYIPSASNLLFLLRGPKWIRPKLSLLLKALDKVLSSLVSPVNKDNYITRTETTTILTCMNASFTTGI